MCRHSHTCVDGVSQDSQRSLTVTIILNLGQTLLQFSQLRVRVRGYSLHAIISVVLNTSLVVLMTGYCIVEKCGFIIINLLLPAFVERRISGTSRFIGRTRYNSFTVH